MNQENAKINDRNFTTLWESDTKFDIPSIPTRNCFYPKQSILTPQKKNNIEIAIDVESTLRNQLYSLQHGADQSIYIPSSSSELYNITVPTATSEESPFIYLQKKEVYQTTENKFLRDFTQEYFNNSTRIRY
jgi:hypothetical protein